MTDFLSELESYANGCTHIQTVLLVGAHPRETNRDDSDIDIVIVTTDKESMINDTSWVGEFGLILDYEVAHFEAFTIIHVRYDDGKDVEFGIVDPSWFSEPLNAGAKRVLTYGYVLLVDKTGSFPLRAVGNNPDPADMSEKARYESNTFATTDYAAPPDPSIQGVTADVLRAIVGKLDHVDDKKEALSDYYNPGGSVDDAIWHALYFASEKGLKLDKSYLPRILELAASLDYGEDALEYVDFSIFED